MKAESITFDYLEEKIKDWANKRGLLENPKPKKQALKSLEEVNELLEALEDNDSDAIIDAVGDTMVTLMVLCQQLDLSLLGCLYEAYNVIKDRNGKLINGTFVKEEDLKK